MKEILEFLKKDRKVNRNFMERLENVGFEIKHGTYSYWNNQEYVQIGRAAVWLVEEKRCNQGTSIQYRYQNEVVEEIIRTINRQKKLLEEADKVVNDFFEKLNGEEASITHD